MGILRKFNEYFYQGEKTENEVDSEPNSDEQVAQIDASEEEEAGDYHGSLGMRKIAKALGENLQGNEIVHDGHKINFFSETEMYHVDKKKFKTPEEVIQFLNSHVHGGKEEHQLESKRNKRK